MATYIMLSRFTERGLQNIKDSPARLEAARKTFQGVGAELKDFYLTTGQYDSVIVVEAPDEATVARASMAIGALGNVRVETLRAFTEVEYKGIVDSLP